MLFSWAHKKKLTAAHVCVTGTGISSGRAGEPCKFSVSSQLADHHFANHCSVAFEGPSKPEINFVTGNEGIFECIWTPKLPGVYKVYVRFNNEQVPGSPFTCTIEGGYLHDSVTSAIRCRGRCLQTGNLNVYNEVLIEGADAVIGGVAVSMEGPGKPDILFRNEQQGLFVLYKCVVPGVYTLNIKFANNHVNGSPFNIRVL
ncbi:Cheerio / Filamin-A/C -like protein [Leptotrombidium deliense]|uniref:Cheerio / Filamin-A/C-like protein n=1 Tax=Leptotrombidium deliense TaxID=299467 RepID=A0A443SQI2_9ACAR|nr:Cheerio / Filamin-A/C -like protein [Leptotrombidium deliense]